MVFIALLLLALSVIIPGTPTLVAAMDIIPFQSSNQSPLIRVFGLPAIGSAIVVPAGRFEGTLTSDVTNNSSSRYLRRQKQSVARRRDLPFQPLSRYGIAPGFQIGIDIPYLANSGGFLDSFIEDFHGAFGLPSGNSQMTPRNRLLYQYTRNGVTKVLVNDGSNGIGDIRLSGAWQLYYRGTEAPRAVALHASIKPPTGNSNRLFGSGSTDSPSG